MYPGVEDVSGNGVQGTLRSLRLCSEGAADGHAHGQFGLAELLVTGNGIQQDGRVRSNNQKAAPPEHPAAMFRLASMMMEEGPMQDIDKSSNYFIKVCGTGDDHGVHRRWGHLLLRGRRTSGHVCGIQLV